MAKWRLRNLFSRTSPTVANQTHTSSSTSHSACNPIPSKPTSPTPSAACLPLPSSSLVQQSKTDAFAISRDFLDKALRGLPCQERETIEKYILTTTDDTDSALRDVLNAAQEKKKFCEDRRWTFTFRGQIVKLRDEADSVVLWLDRFKQVGDIAVNADPIHAGLPWAGIRFLLEAVISESRQMAALLVGLKIALYTMNRLKAYMDYLRTLPVTRTRTNFETSLTELHTLILQFLARAIQTYQKSTLTRALDAFWKPEEVRDFESECDKIGARVEIEASNCDRTLNALQRQAGNQPKENLHRVLKELEELRDVKESVSLLSNKIDLAKLPLAKGATFDSHQDEHNAACLENTRVDEQRQIAKWAEDPHSKCIFWLNGMAGTGKSTISRSVAKTCKEKGLLGASFFFKRGESDRGNARRFFTTIATQLAIKVPRLVPSIVKVIDDDPTISDKVLREQFEKLVLQPLSELVYVPRKTSKLIIVIDALDECEREGDMREILRLLAQAKDVRPVCLRVFVTSRPELPIRLGFAEILGTRPDLVLHEIPSATTKHDISTYLRHEFAKIRAENLRRNHPYSLSADWPGDENIQALVEMANPLFIFAATVCRFVADLKGNPKKRLKVILDYQTESQTSKLDGTYLPILDQLLVDQDMAEKETLGREFRELVGAIIILADPLSIVSLASLLGIEKEDVNGRLESLHSVLNIPTNEDASVRLLHLSFRDFLLNLPRRGKSPFGVDERETHGILASKCLELLSTPGCLKENMCDIDGPGTLQTEVDTRVIDGRLPAHVQYACRYWVYHLEESKCSIRDGDQVYVFLHEHLLHWLEAISLMGKISESIAILGILQSLASIGESTELSRFIYDARRFILKNRWIIEMAPLQLYSSAIVFAPKTSIVRSIFKNQIPKWIGRLPKVPLTWSLELQKLEGHSDGVRDVAFSHDGQLLASASEDQTVRLWNSATGAELQKLSGHNGVVTAVSFSHDSQLLASASYDQTIRLWDPVTGAELQTLDGHVSWVRDVAFSHDGQLLASASSDRTVRLWNPATGAELQKFESHSGEVMSVVFSHDGQLLASASKDQTVRLWNPATGAELQKLEGHSDGVMAVAFSYNSQLLASASDDQTIRLWDPETGAELQKLEGHSREVRAVAFSHDSQLLASASYDQTIRLWDPVTGAELQKLDGHISWVRAVVFSHDGQLFASASDDRTIRLWNQATGAELIGAVTLSYNSQLLASAPDDQTIRLWDPETGAELQELDGHSGEVMSVVFSHDSQLLASTSEDQTIRLWNPVTGAELQKLNGHSGEVRTVIFSHDSQLLASVSEDQTVRLWNLATGAEPQKFDGHSGVVRDVAFSHDSQLLATASNDQTVKIWNLATGAELQNLSGHSNIVKAVTFSHDGQLLASASYDKTVRIWNPATGAELQKLESHSGWVRAVAFSHNGQLLASASDDRTIRLWNPATGAELQKLEGHSSVVTAVAFSHDSQLLASASHDETVRLWNLATGAELQKFQLNILVFTLSFSMDSQCLETNRGRLLLHPSLTSPCPLEPKVTGNIFLNGHWITRNSQNLLWLPYDYRIACSVAQGNVLAIGQSSGQVTFMEFGS